MGRHVACGSGVHAQGGSAVKAIPAKPQDESAEDHQRDVVRGKFFLVASIESTCAWSQDNGTNQCTDTTSHVDNAAAGKVVVAHIGDSILTGVEPAGSAPGPIHDHRVDEGRHADGVDGVAREEDTLRHTSADNRCRCSAESPLEEPAEGKVCRHMSAVAGDICEEAVAEVLLVAREHVGVVTCAVRNHPAKRPPAKSAAADVCQVLQHQVLGVLRSACAAFKHGEACLHEHHQCSAEDQPDVIKRTLQICHRVSQGHGCELAGLLLAVVRFASSSGSMTRCSMRSTSLQSRHLSLEGLDLGNQLRSDVCGVLSLHCVEACAAQGKRHGNGAGAHDDSLYM
mmetsp:Transcript_41221/g.96818  ORF Transcript_41221/g.96818 Transcript_41221/m.96818 type:complete len:341 (+) Transcript_41221:843-1865(+)